MEFFSKRLLRDLNQLEEIEEVREVNDATKVALNELGDRKGRNVTFEQIVGLLEAKLNQVNVLSRYPVFRKVQELPNPLPEIEIDDTFGLDDELSVLQSTLPLVTSEAARAARIWFTKTLSAEVVNFRAWRDIRALSGDVIDGHYVAIHIKRLRGFDEAVKLLNERFNLED